MAAAPAPPALPSVAETGGIINASPNDWRAMLIGLALFFAMMIMLFIWREFASSQTFKMLTKSVDGMRDALNALNTLIVTAIAEGRGRQSALDEQQGRQDTRQGKQDEREGRQDERQERQDKL